MMSFIIGEILFIGLIVAACMSSGSIMDFVDIPSILLVFGGGFGITIISFTLQDIWNAIAHTFGKEDSPEKLQQSAYFWLATIRNLLAIGTIGTLIGNIQLLGNLEDISQIGPAIAISLITFLYGILSSAILPLPAYFILQRRIADRVQ